METVFMWFSIVFAFAFVFGVPISFSYGLHVGMKAGSGGSKGLFGVVQGSSGLAPASFFGGKKGGGPDFSADNDEKLLVDEQVERYLEQVMKRGAGPTGRMGAVGALVDPELAGRAPSFVGGDDE